MRYQKIKKELFELNRNRLNTHLLSNSICIIVSNDIYPTNADGSMPFKQNSDLFYLSGIDQENTKLIIFPDARNQSDKEILFIVKTNETIKIWEGEKLSKQQASEISGIENIKYLSEFDSVVTRLTYEAENIYLNLNEHDRNTNKVETAEKRLVFDLKNKFPLHNFKRLAPIFHQLRVIKSEIEIDLIKKACEITAKAYRRVLQMIKPNIFEFEIEAEITHELIKNRATKHAYQPILASGSNACVLHYINNNDICKDGDLILMDFGAEYANYCADLTRTIPINGVFSKRQKEVYKSVQFILIEAQKRLIKGNTFEKYNQEMQPIIEDQLVKLNLISLSDIQNQLKDQPVYRKFFMHGLSHFLGLDVHDVGHKNMIFEEGMILTCEPGIYITAENIGIRLENNILITENGNENLMANFPIDIDEIEMIINRM